MPGPTADPLLDPQQLPGLPGPVPAPAPDQTGGEQQLPPASIRDQYRAQAYERMGLDADQFHSMDPVARNRLITQQYAQMYMSDPDTYKWAGMAAFASDKAGVGMQQTELLDAGRAIPGGDFATDLVGAPEGSTVFDALAVGNAGIYDDMMWQHLAFESGGIEEMERAAEMGEIPEGQLEGWRQLAAGQAALAEARASGDEAAIEAAQRQVWGGNRTLLHHEQQFVQGIAYDMSPESREAFQFLSSGWNVMGVESPIPGDSSFGEYREDRGRTGTADIGDFDQRWDWIDGQMLPAYMDMETGNNAEMMQHMQRYADGGGNPDNPIYQNAEPAAHILSPLIDMTPIGPALRVLDAVSGSGLLDAGADLISDIGTGAANLGTGLVNAGGAALDVLSDGAGALASGAGSLIDGAGSVASSVLSW